MVRRKIEGLRTIVTGASSGIGREIAIELAKRGAKLIVTARRAERLEELLTELKSLEAEAVAVIGDIVDANTREALVAAASREFGGLDALVNNAGIGALGPFADADEDRMRRVMEVNFFAPIELIRLALPLLREGNRPIVVNVSSVLGHRAVANKSEYCASKFAIHGFSDALRCELTGDGIDLLLVSPSTTSSEFFDHVIDKDDDGSTHAKRAMAPHVVARKTVGAMRRGKHEIILSGGGKALVWLDRLCPPIMNRILARFR
ncbi:MAG: SDR family oxidoreductase [Planctomycetaceae bacterium]|nr:SDR family oxidoreductase [Planctomycetales bacterium]MCB9875391.1 SDR family oxidoreductase [Planctomycetaceae bacterium]MCB9937311.1 SDR family oxidoreductase [Planctomycetaceae bacterium]HRX82132.1 SDR family oxidoreductase [Pirellulaceae bacterium]